MWSRITANIQRDSFSIFQLRDDFSIWRRMIQSCWMFFGFLEQWRQVFSAAFQFPTIGQHLVLLLAGEKPDDNRLCCGTFCRAAMPARFVTNEVVTNRAGIALFFFYFFFFFFFFFFNWILVHVILYVSLVCVRVCMRPSRRACVRQRESHTKRHRRKESQRQR